MTPFEWMAQKPFKRSLLLSFVSWVVGVALGILTMGHLPLLANFVATVVIMFTYTAALYVFFKYVYRKASRDEDKS